MNLKSIGVASAFCVAMAAAPAHAGFGVEFQDVTFIIDVVDEAEGTFTLNIDNLLNASGDWENVTHVFALGFKGFGTNFNVTSSTISPAGQFAVGNQLNAMGCDGGTPAQQFCFEYSPLLQASNDMTFLIDLAGSFDADSITPHLKVNFTDAQGNKIGSLLSRNLPEPGVLGLLGLSLVMLGLVRRRRQIA